MIAIYFDVKAGDTEEWVILNPSAATHPFHIHVIPFQAKVTRTDLSINESLVPANKREMVKRRINTISHIDHPNEWRDSIVIPAKGMVRMWIRFPEHLVGKTAFHCHFLAHEETGMLQNFVISPNEVDKPEER